MNRTPRSFRFQSYSFEPQKKRVRFFYAFEFAKGPAMEFTETLHLPSVPGKCPAELLKSVLEGLHLMLGISYYKLFCPGKVEVPYKLSKAQAAFWTTVYRKGLGEFAFRNKLDPRRFAKFSGTGVRAQSFDCPRKDRSLLGIGGGKDSIIAGELMKEAGKEFDAFLAETGAPSEVVRNVVKTMGVRSISIQRELDEKIFHPIVGTYNGHIPISAVFAFVGLLTAILYDYRYVIVSNEHSSNFGNVMWKGEEVNHQWSKSAEFEKMFQTYVRDFITPDVTYFSLMRPFYEIRIVEMFTRYPKYFPVFTSCNRSFRVRRERGKKLWCGECAKCIFVFTLMSAFLPKKKVVEIFGKDLYADASLKPMFRDLLGEGKMKPFDCVGTFEEMKVAYQVVLGHGFKVGDVFKTVQAPTVPTPFRLLGMKNVLIAGYGREGKVTEAYLKKFYPKLKRGIADETEGAGYLKKQEDYDFVIKTPGLSKTKITRPYTTATNLFFEAVQKCGNTVIGVTGSKGKSTTASLIAHILAKGGKKVRLMGNIGKPMLSALLGPIAKNEIFVLELSSYQLDDSAYSPNIAVATNLFPEHMTYHGGEKNYYEAKKNIIRWQSAEDTFVYNPKNVLMRAWAKSARAKILPFATKLPLKDAEIPLLGEHNKSNVAAAVAVARLMGVSDAAIGKGIKSFKALPHRLEFVGRFKNIDFYDDAISTTPQSTLMALKALRNVDTIFLGGEDRGYDFSALEVALRKHKIRNVVLFPDTGKRMLKSEKGFRVLHTKKMAEAVKFAYENTAAGKVCLLSMASPSYSLWKNFEEKGDEFQRSVKVFK